MFIWASLAASAVASDTLIELAISNDSEANRKLDEKGSA
jgi:hypothetical protein